MKARNMFVPFTLDKTQFSGYFKDMLSIYQSCFLSFSVHHFVTATRVFPFNLFHN